MKYLISLLLLFHGWIHFIGFARALNLAPALPLKKDVSIPFGILWLISGLLFIYLAFAFLGHKDWYFAAFTTVILSQLLVFIFWQDAKAASIINLLIFSLALVQYSGDRFESLYMQDAIENLEQLGGENEFITQEDMGHLPSPVAKYLRYTGVIKHEKVKSIHVEMDGQMRKQEGAWFSFNSSQYNFVREPARFFFMKARISSLPAYGYHSYHQNEARMRVKMMALFPVADLEGEMLFKAETVTFLNDLCIFAPAALIDKRISWKAVNDTVSEVTLPTEVFAFQRCFILIKWDNLPILYRKTGMKYLT